MFYVLACCSCLLLCVVLNCYCTVLQLQNLRFQYFGANQPKKVKKADLNYKIYTVTLFFFNVFTFF